MTGHYDFKFTDAEIKNLRDHLTHENILFASDSTGLKPFDTAFRREIKRVFPDSELLRLPPSHPIYTSGWEPVEHVTYTPPALRDNPALNEPELYGLFLNGRLAVIYSPFDLMSGVNHESNAYAKGVVSDDATKLLINAITYCMTN